MIESRLTTIDNPFSPFDEWEDWYSYDERVGHHTTSFLARMVVNSNELSDADYQLAIENAIDEIIAENITGMYKRVSRVVPDYEEETQTES